MGSTSKATGGFITKEEFCQKVEKQKVLNWLDLREDKIFKVENFEKVEGKYGTTAILHIVDKENIQQKVWAPSRLLTEVEKNASAKNPRSVYFISKGQNTVQNKTFNNFDVILK